MGSININFEKQVLVSDIQNIIDRLFPNMENAMSDIGGIILDYVLAYTPIGESEDLYNSTVIEMEGLGFIIYSFAPEFVWVIEGTKAHEILPVNAEALYWPGALHPVKRVWHPGTIANDYMGLALMDSIFEVETRCDELLNQIEAGT
jgi:hypothetical protein